MENDCKPVSKWVLARGIAKYNAEAHRRSSAAYHSRNQDQLREKAWIRMAVRRQRLKEHNSDWEIQKERARVSDRKYRQKHAEDLALKQRVRRENAYIEKYGVEAHIERGVQEENTRRAKAAAIAQEVAAEDERQQRRAGLMNWAAQKGNDLPAHSFVLDTVGQPHSVL
ncbi:hypothetical protein K438DRAFT_1925745 [Mycena galopus ATCC 62051]|nr:hypothetical protein K438DRAFT_1925745 [Mycena galopus ATCC 62051]